MRTRLRVAFTVRLGFGGAMRWQPVAVR